ncbi:unnamed protein product [Victoria cruziana]
MGTGIWFRIISPHSFQLESFSLHVKNKAQENLVSLFTLPCLKSFSTQFRETSFEVNSALETLVLLSSKYFEELISSSSRIYGILDYLEGFNEENLHKVYEIFSHLALTDLSNTSSTNFGITNELLMIICKQISNPVWCYKRMGIIDTLKVVSLLSDINAATRMSTYMKTNTNEALDLLRITLNSCKISPLLSILLYDQLALLLRDCGIQLILSSGGSGKRQQHHLIVIFFGWWKLVVKKLAALVVPFLIFLCTSDSGLIDHGHDCWFNSGLSPYSRTIGLAR